MKKPYSSCSSKKTFCNPLNLNYSIHNDNHGGEVPNAPFREGADPSIEIFQNEYYLFSSATNGYWCSKDLLNWEFINNETEILPTLNRWAPTTVTIEDELYVMFSEGNIFKNKTPKNPLSWVELPDTCEHTGDPQFFFDKTTDRLWLTHACSDQGYICIHELDIKTMKRIGEVIKLYVEDHANRGSERQGNNNEIDVKGWTEGTQMIKYKNNYYFIYSGHQIDISYANSVLIGASPIGPFEWQVYNPFSQKLTGFIGGAAHGQVFEDLHGNWWNIVLQSVWVNHRWERRIAIFPTGFTDDGQINTDTLFGDYPILLSKRKHENSIISRSAGYMLLSRDCAVSVSSFLEEFPAQNAVTENVKEIWSAKSSYAGEWLSVDLGEECFVNSIQINFAEINVTNLTSESQYIQYLLEYSNDGQEYNTLIDKSKNNSDVPHDYIEFNEPIFARYFKITNVHTAFNGKFAIRGFRIFGKADGQAPKKADFKVIRNKDDERDAFVKWDKVSDALGYVIRYGIAPDKLFRTYEIYSDECEIKSLNKNVEYFVTLDTFNKCGYTKGENVIKI